MSREAYSVLSAPEAERPFGVGRTFTLQAALAAGLLALVGSFLAVSALEDSSQVAIFALVAVCGLAVAAVVGSLRLVLLGAIVIDIPLQWDIQMPLGTHSPAVGGVVAGLQLSITTVSLGALFALWAASALARGGGYTAGASRFESLKTQHGPQHGTLLPPAPLLGAVPLLIFLAITALSVLAASDPLLASFGVQVVLEAVLLFVYVAGTVRRRSEITLISAVLLAGLFVEGALVAATRFVGFDATFLGLSSIGGGGGELERFGGTIGNPNTAASFFAFVSALALATLWWRQERWLRWLGCAAFVMGLVGLFMTFSRGGWLAFALSIAVLFYGATRRGWVSFGRLTLAIGGLLLVLSPIIPALVERVTTSQDTALARWPLIGVARDMIVDKPVLGVGANHFTVVQPSFMGPDLTGAFIAAVHNKSLLIWAESGPFAVAAFVWFLLATVARGWRLTRVADPLVSRVALALVAGLVGQIAHMMIEPYHHRSQVGLVALAAGMIAAMALFRPSVPDA